MSSNANRFFWYDVMTTDTKAAEAFYKEVVGWSVEEAGSGGPDYTVFTTDGSGVAGLMPIPEDAKAMGATPTWTGYIWVENVDDYVGRVTAAGGKVYREANNIPDVGRFAVVADPHGAAFILFRPEGPAGDVNPQPTSPGHIGWHELYAGDLESDFSFYSGLFGWTKERAVDMGPMGIYQTFSMGGHEAGGMMTQPPQIPAHYWLFYFNVEAVDAATARVTSAGGKVLMGPHEVPGGMWIVQCEDPQGAKFALVAPRR